MRLQRPPELEAARSGDVLHRQQHLDFGVEVVLRVT